MCNFNIYAKMLTAKNYSKLVHLVIKCKGINRPSGSGSGIFKV